MERVFYLAFVIRLEFLIVVRFIRVKISINCLFINSLVFVRVNVRGIVFPSLLNMLLLFVTLDFSSSTSFDLEHTAFREFFEVFKVSVSETNNILQELG